MRETLADIRKGLQSGSYQNEEHVRVAIVVRILQKLGWDIWDPQQVNAEFVAVPSEDKTKVDLALFLRPSQPCVFIEVKAVGRMGNLGEIERQLRDYNRNNTALFSIITDGRTWRFYHSQTGGEFSNKWFKTLDIVSDNTDDLERVFSVLLAKAEVESGRAKKEAEALLGLTQRQRVMQDSLPKARRIIQEAPFPSLPNALVDILSSQGFQITLDEANDFILSSHPTDPAPLPLVERGDTPAGATTPQKVPPDTRRLNPDQPGSLTFTSVYEARFGSEQAKGWNDLVLCGLRIARRSGHDFGEIRQWVTGQVAEGALTKSGFRPVHGTDLSWQNRDANGSWENALRLAKKLNVVIEVKFRWRTVEGAAFPGEEGYLYWSPR